MTPAILDQTVFSKPYFERRGLILAEDEEGPVGFLHVSKSPTSANVGIISMIMISSRANAQEMGRELIEKAEQQFKEMGIREIVAGEVPPQNPFYLGLYGGSNSPGFLQSDKDWIDLFTDAGFAPCARQIVLQRSLTGFRPPINRKIVQVRRRFHVASELDPAITNWREACTVGQTDRIRFSLISRDGDQVANVCFWEMEPLASSWGVHAAGILNFWVAEEHRRQAIATFLLGESLRKLQMQGITLIETQVPADNEDGLAFFTTFGFEKIDEGIHFSKEIE